MNSKQSMLKLFLGVAGMGLLITNCTIKTATDDGGAGSTTANNAGSGNASSGDCSPVGKKFTGCICGDQSVSYQVCQADGTYGSCVCTTASQGGGSNGGASNAAGATNTAGTGGEPVVAEAGAGGEGPTTVSSDCYTCLTQLCAPEWAACNMNDETNPNPDTGAYCISSQLDDSGQIEKIIDCITTERATGLAKRDAVRACGSSIGASSSPANFVWAPPTMTPETEALMNCMADAPTETMPGAWATDPNNFPAAGPRAWDPMTCAKLACTSML